MVKNDNELIDLFIYYAMNVAENFKFYSEYYGTGNASINRIKKIFDDNKKMLGTYSKFISYEIKTLR